MKKIIISIFCLSLLFIPVTSFALDLGSGLAKEAAVGAGYDAGTTETSLSQIIGTGVKLVLSLAGVIFTILIVYAGYLWMTARGEESKVEKAQSIISQSIVGLIIAVGAYSITAFIVPKLLEQTTGGGGDLVGPCCEVCLNNQCENKLGVGQTECENTCGSQEVCNYYDQCRDQ
jgi:hypothetical protein